MSHHAACNLPCGSNSELKYPVVCATPYCEFRGLASELTFYYLFPFSGPGFGACRNLVTGFSNQIEAAE